MHTPEDSPLSCLIPHCAGKHGSMPLHSHVEVTETYTVVSGRGGVALNGQEMEISASNGELVIPPGERRVKRL